MEFRLDSFRIERIKEYVTTLQSEINKRDNILKKYKKIKNTFSVIGKISAVVTTATAAGGIAGAAALASTIALLPVSVALDGVVVVCGVTLLVATKLFDCVSDKIEKHKHIKLLAISKLEIINKILGEDEQISQEEFNTISDQYEEFHKQKIEIQRKYSKSIN
jgi:hypothetical protein